MNQLDSSKLADGAPPSKSLRDKRTPLVPRTDGLAAQFVPGALARHHAVRRLLRELIESALSKFDHLQRLQRSKKDPAAPNGLLCRSRFRSRC